MVCQIHLAVCFFCEMKFAFHWPWVLRNKFRRCLDGKQSVFHNDQWQAKFIWLYAAGCELKVHSPPGLGVTDSFLQFSVDCQIYLAARFWLRTESSQSTGIGSCKAISTEMYGLPNLFDCIFTTGIIDYIHFHFSLNGSSTTKSFISHQPPQLF